MGAKKRECLKLLGYVKENLGVLLVLITSLKHHQRLEGILYVVFLNLPLALFSFLPVLSMSFIFFTIVLAHLRPCCSQKDCGSQGEPIPRDTKQFTHKLSFQMQTHQSRTHTPTWFYQALISGPASTCPNHPRNREQMTRNNPYALEVIEMIQTSQPTACSPCFTHSFPQEPPQRLFFFFSFFLLTNSRASQVAWHAHAPPLGNCEQQIIFDGSHFLLCRPQYTSNRL